MLGTLEAGDILLADTAFASDTRRESLEARGVFANIRPMGRRNARPAFSRYLYRSRNLVERFFNELKHFRAVDRPWSVVSGSR